MLKWPYLLPARHHIFPPRPGSPVATRRSFSVLSNELPNSLARRLPAPRQLLQIIRRINRTARRVLPLHPVVQIQRPAPIRTKGKRLHIRVRQNCLAHRTFEHRPVIPRDLRGNITSHTNTLQMSKNPSNWSTSSRPAQSLLCPLRPAGTLGLTLRGRLGLCGRYRLAFRRGSATFRLSGSGGARTI